MNINNEMKIAHENLSLYNARFLDFVERKPEALNLSNFTLLELNDDLFQLQPWPTFISRRTRAETKEASEKTFELIKSIPQRFFGNSVEKIQQYYGLSESMVKSILDATNEQHMKGLLGRGDFILTTSGWKCIEYNVTANLGGMAGSILGISIFKYTGNFRLPGRVSNKT